MSRTILSWILVPAGIIFAGMLGIWWISIIWTFVVLALLHLGIKKSILIGGISFGLVWLIVPIFSLMSDKSDLIGRTADLLGGLSPVVLILVTSTIGFVSGSLAGWLGGALGQMHGKYEI